MKMSPQISVIFKQKSNCYVYNMTFKNITVISPVINFVNLNDIESSEIYILNIFITTLEIGPIRRKQFFDCPSY